MEIKTVGFFKEFENIQSDGSSLVESISNKEHPEEEKIVKYLKSGNCLAVCPSVSFDIIAKEKIVAGTPNILTDGMWVWPSELSYYVEKYHVILPEEFIAEMKANNWRVPILTKSQLDSLVDYLLDIVWQIDTNNN